MNPLRITATRGDLVESAHDVSVAVVDVGGRLVASAGDPGYVTFWRSAAKPFQALPLLEDGGAAKFGLGVEELALACASHSSEPVHLEVTDRFLDKIGCAESDLACGPHARSETEQPILSCHAATRVVCIASPECDAQASASSSSDTPNASAAPVSISGTACTGFSDERGKIGRSTSPA